MRRSPSGRHRRRVRTGAGGTPLPCRVGDTRGCARGGPILDENGTPLASVGINTGKVDVFDTGQNRPGQVPVDGGGIPIYRGGKVIGGVGVAGVPANLGEYAATLASAGRGADGFLGTARHARRGPDRRRAAAVLRHLHQHPVHSPHAADAADGLGPGNFSDGTFLVQPRDGIQAPENYIIGPKGPDQPRGGSLTVADVRRIIDQAVAAAFQTRAMIRLPINQPTRMTIGVADETGDILALFRMPDGTVFSSDVAMSRRATPITSARPRATTCSANRAQPTSANVGAASAGGQGVGADGADAQLRRPAALPARDRALEASGRSRPWFFPFRLRLEERVHRRTRARREEYE